MGYGTQITSRFSAGLQVNYITEKIWNTSANALTFNLGTIYRLNERGCPLGFCLIEPGHPRTASAGATWRSSTTPIPTPTATTAPCRPSRPPTSFPAAEPVPPGLERALHRERDSALLFLVEGLHPNDNSESLNLGVEWTLARLLALRAGYQTLFQTDVAAGLDLRLRGRGRPGRATVTSSDYAWAGHDYLEDTHRLTLVIDF